MRRPRKAVKAKVGAKLSRARTSPKKPGSRNRELEGRLAEALKREAEVLEQQAATSEILRVISSSPTDLQYVFDTIAERAMRLCGALHGVVLRFDGELIHLVALANASPEAGDALRRVFPTPPGRHTSASRAILTGTTIDIANVQNDPDYAISGAARTAGYRSVVSVPMLRDGRAIGTLNVHGAEVGQFSERQVRLLQTFADQAVIAIENARLLNETKAALEQQTATGEILRVIASSPTDLQPVMEAVAENAARVCGATDCHVLQLDADVLRLMAQYGTFPLAFGVGETIPARGNSIAGRAIHERRTIHVEDMFATPAAEFTETKARMQSLGQRSQTVLATPLLREGATLGVIIIRRMEVRPFNRAQIELLQTFADQAVIAIENVRLFTELQTRNRELTESLEQQTATSEILRVIASSPTDVQPVLDTVVRSAARFCGADDVTIHRLEAVGLTVVAHHGAIRAPIGFVAPVVRGTTVGRAVLERRAVHVADLQRETEDFPEGSAVAREMGYRTILSVPLLREGVPLGVILLRRPEVEPFSEKQVTLLHTFADQAVIAIENVRLFHELEEKNRALTLANADVTEALEQQTATSEILRVISSSPTDVQPVFDTIARSAARLCEAQFGEVVRFDGHLLHFVAHHGLSPEGVELDRRIFPSAPDRRFSAGRAVLDAAVAHIPDVQADPDYKFAAEAKIQAYRSIVAIPMLRDGIAVGAIAVSRSQPGRFPDRQIELLKTFADQAVIAIENVRLFHELEEKNRALTQAHAQMTEALEQKTATAEILQVISRSATDVQPVFDTIAASARRLCDALYSVVFRFDGEMITLVADDGASSEQLEVIRSAYPARPGRSSLAAQAILERRVIAIADALTDSEYPHLAERARAIGYRSIVSVPMLRGDTAIGAINVLREEALPFSDTQIELLKTFADQAVIAIENVRLFQELQTRNRELTETLEQQTATSEILRVISSSPTDVQPVFDVIARSAARLCEAFDGVVYRVDGEVLRPVARHGSVEGRRPLPLVPGTVNGRAVIDRRLIHVADVQAEEEEFPEGAVISRQEGTRTFVSVPLLREGGAIGTIGVRRLEVRPFTDKQIALLQTFADQAVIAIENVRLFQELQARNRDLTATSEILEVISRSPTDVQPVFDTIAERAMRLCDAAWGGVYMFDGALIHLSALTSVRPEGADALRQAFPRAPSYGSVVGRVILTGDVAEIPDVLADPEYQLKDPAGAADHRNLLGVPLLLQGRAIGVMVVTRPQPGGFSADQIQLLKTFASQAVIAVENVRLFQELEARTRDLTRSVGELRALGEVSQAVSATLDVETVLQTVVSRANQLAGADGCSIYEYDEATREFRMRAAHNLDTVLAGTIRAMPLRMGEGVMGRAAERREPLQVADIAEEGTYQSRLRDVLLRAGYRATLTVPLLREDELIGTLSVLRKTPGEFAPEVVELLRTFATQSALAIQNARLFREIADKSQQLEAASRHKSEFLANMSHELRTPLNAILGFNELILGDVYGELSPDLREPLTDIQNSGKHLLRLINNVLDLSKIEAGRMELSPTDYAVQDVVERVRASLHPLAAEKGLELVASASEAIPLAYGDAGRITQCLLNLAGNALKFTRQGRVEISVDLDGDLLVYRVADTGIGIAKDKLETVFGEFRQGDSTITSEFGGTGLGLSITKKFVEMHGGRIWVESDVGKGSIFSFAIPLRLTGGQPA